MQYNNAHTEIQNKPYNIIITNKYVSNNKNQVILYIDGLRSLIRLIVQDFAQKRLT